jgi:hypothetical protein
MTLVILPSAREDLAGSDYYSREEETVFVRAVLDCRRDPAWIRERLK